MKKIIAVFFFLILPSITQSQIVQNNTGSFNELAFFVGINNSEYDEAQGSRYLNEQFVPARINNIRKVQKIRLNGVDNSIELLRDNGIIVVLSQLHEYDIKLLDESNKEYVSKSYKNYHGDKETGFLEKKHSNKNYTLYKQERIKFIPKKPSKSSYEPEVPAKFIKGSNHYYILGLPSKPLELVHIPRKKKDFLALFANQAKTMKKWLKKEKLKIDDSEDLIAIFNYYLTKK